jgi:hypothetical protein
MALMQNIKPKIRGAMKIPQDFKLVVRPRQNFEKRKQKLRSAAERNQTTSEIDNHYLNPSQKLLQKASPPMMMTPNIFKSEAKTAEVASIKGLQSKEKNEY